MTSSASHSRTRNWCTESPPAHDTNSVSCAGTVGACAIDAGGHVVGFGGRVLGQGEPKYLNSPEGALFRKSEMVYALDRARAAIGIADWLFQ